MSVGCGSRDVTTKLPSTPACVDWREPSGIVTVTGEPGRALPKTIRRRSDVRSCCVTTTSPRIWRLSVLSTRKVRSAVAGAAFRALSACWRPWSSSAAPASVSVTLPAGEICRLPCSCASVSAMRPPLIWSRPDSLASTSPIFSPCDKPSAALKLAALVGVGVPVRSTLVRLKACATERLSRSTEAGSAGGLSLAIPASRTASSVSGVTLTRSSVAPLAVVLVAALPSPIQAMARSGVSNERGAALTSST